MRCFKIIFPLIIINLLFAQNQNLQKAFEYFAQSRFARAEKQLLQYSKTHPNDPFALNLLGHIYLNSQKFSDAVHVFQKAQSLSPYEAAIALNLGKALEKSGQLLSAEKQYLRAMQDSSLARQAKLSLAQLYFRQNWFKKALHLYQDLIRTEPGNSYFFKQAGRCALKEFNNPMLAESYLQKALQLSTTDLDVYILLFNLYKKSQNWNNALQIVQQGLIQFPQNAQLLLAAGDSYFSTRKYDQAVNHYHRALQNGDSTAYLFKKLGAAYYYANNYPSALLALKKSIQKDNQDPISYYFLGLTQKALHLNSKAIESLNKALRLSLPNYLTDIYFHLAEAYQKQKNYSRAITLYKKVMETDSSLVMPMFYLATIYDDYYKDRQTPLSYYQKFLEKAGDSVDERYKNYALERMKAIREQLHFQKGRQNVKKE